MNLNHTVKVVGSVLLSAVMAGSMMPVTVFAKDNSDANPTEKTETVYSVLNSDGSISDTIVSSWLHDEDGINNIKETLNLKNVKNIKTNEKPSKNGNTYTWNTKGNDVYYEGDGTEQLPVSVKIRYELDGQEMSAKEIDGKSGHLKLTITFTNNKSETKNINGKSIVVHPSFLAGGMLNMSTGNFTNVKCDAGKIVNDGTNEILAFANIPGLNETLTSAGLEKVNDQLGISDDVTVEADVDKFDLGSIMIGMTNEINLEQELDSIDSVSELTDGIDQLMEADDQLVDGSKQLYDGTTQLKEQASPLTSASGQVRELSAGAIQLNDGVKSLQTGLNAYTSGSSQIIASAKEGLYNISVGTGQLSYAINTNRVDKDGVVTPSLRTIMSKISLGLQAIKDSSDSNNFNAENLKSAISTTNKELENMDTYLQGTTTELGKLEGILEEASQGIKNLNSMLTNQLQPAVDAANGTIDSKNSEIAETQKQIDSYYANINGEISTIEGTISQLEELANALPDDNQQKSDIQGQISNLKNELADLKSKSQTKLNTVTSFDANDFAQLKAIVSGANDYVIHMSESIGTAQDAIGSLNDYLTKSKISLKNMTEQLSKTPVMDDQSILDLMESLNTGVGELQDGIAGVNTYIDTIDESLKDIKDSSSEGVNTINYYSKDLDNGKTQLTAGTSALSTATGTLAGQSGTFNEMADGLDTLGEAFETLNEGAKTLYEGNEQFKSEGLEQLKSKVDLGVGELETLQDVMDAIKAMNKEYSSYSGAPEGATVTSRYVFRTKDSSSK